MSHSETLARLTIEERRSDMSRWARGNGIDKFEQEWNVPIRKLIVLDNGENL
jgi:hypothetical protein